MIIFSLAVAGLLLLLRLRRKIGLHMRFCCFGQGFILGVLKFLFYKIQNKKVKCQDFTLKYSFSLAAQEKNDVVNH
jgi:hypothetical protein